MKRHLAALLLLCGMLPLHGCGFAREFTTFADEIAEQAEMLDAWSFDVDYLGDINRNTTYSETGWAEINADIESIWSNHIAHYAPEPTGILVIRGPGTYSMPSKAPAVVPPPKKTEIERLENSDIFIIRTPEGEITVTNKADQK